MSNLDYRIAIEGNGADCQDRAQVFEAGDALVFVVADGAGGSRFGGLAADLVLSRLKTFLDQGASLDQEASWRGFLRDVDLEIAHRCSPGETTAVVLASAPDRIVGASVGDSEAWLVRPEGWGDLTSGQRRKPLLGSGRADPISFRHEGEGGVLVLGSDGLFKYARPDLIRSAVLDDPTQIPSRLIDLARMPNGKLQDDIAAIVCRRPIG